MPKTATKGKRCSIMVELIVTGIQLTVLLHAVMCEVHAALLVTDAELA